MSLPAISSVFHTPVLPELTQASLDILESIKNSTNSIFKNETVLTKELKKTDSLQLTAILTKYFDEMVEKGLDKDPVEVLDRIASLMPFDKLQDTLKGQIDSLLDEAQDMIEAAKYYYDATKSTSPAWHVRLTEFFEGFISALEGLISAFGIADFFKPAESEIHADIKSQRIMILMSLFNMIVGLISLFEATTAGLYIGIAFLLIGALSLVWNYIKPMPNYLPGDSENWTRQIQKRGCNAEGRKETLDQIANILKMNRHVLLTGPSRVGKTLTALAFTQAIERGDYPELKGKKVFRINTADIIGDDGGPAVFTGGSVLKRISEAMGNHREDIILVLDEIHNACRKHCRLADQLKTFLDEAGEFPHVIGITTDEEYNKQVKNNTAFSLRFDRVEIKNTRDDETLKILSDTLLKSSFKPVVDEESLLYIYEKSIGEKDAPEPQPSASIKLLKRCIHKTGKTQKSATEKKISEIAGKIDSLRAQAVATRGRKRGISAEIRKLEIQLNEFKVTFENEKKRSKICLKRKIIWTE